MKLVSAYEIETGSCRILRRLLRSEGNEIGLSTISSWWSTYVYASTDILPSPIDPAASVPQPIAYIL